MRPFSCHFGKKKILIASSGNNNILFQNNLQKLRKSCCSALSVPVTYNKLYTIFGANRRVVVDLPARFCETVFTVFLFRSPVAPQFVVRFGLVLIHIHILIHYSSIRGPFFIILIRPIRLYSIRCLLLLGSSLFVGSLPCRL